jgi:SAM-dependent methyltransferase
MFTRAPFSYDNGFACYHDKSHPTDDIWFRTLDRDHWNRLVAGQRAGQQHKIEFLLVPTLKRYGIEPGARVLSLGCGMGFDVLGLRQHGYKAIGCDFGGRTREWVDNGLNPEMAFLANAVDLPLANESFDAVFMWHVIEHFGCGDGNQIMAADTWSIRQNIVERVRAILKPGGVCVVGVPNKWFPLDQYHGPHFYINPKLHAWANRRNLGIHYFWDKRDFLLSKHDLEKLFSKFSGLDWLSLSIGLALDKGLDHKEHSGILSKYARVIDATGLSTSFLSPALHLAVRR